MEQIHQGAQRWEPEQRCGVQCPVVTLRAHATRSPRPATVRLWGTVSRSRGRAWRLPGLVLTDSIHQLVAWPRSSADAITLCCDSRWTNQRVRIGVKATGRDWLLLEPQSKGPQVPQPECHVPQRHLVRDSSPTVGRVPLLPPWFLDTAARLVIHRPCATGRTGQPSRVRSCAFHRLHRPHTTKGRSSLWTSSFVVSSEAWGRFMFCGVFVRRESLRSLVLQRSDPTAAGFLFEQCPGWAAPRKGLHTNQKRPRPTAPHGLCAERGVRECHSCRHACTLDICSLAHPALWGCVWGAAGSPVSLWNVSGGSHVHTHNTTCSHCPSFGSLVLVGPSWPLALCWKGLCPGSRAQAWVH
ncbi:unnamed protein product [Nyctereutes procyonoides]|uniref:(raccoon dog) hypothetical protein n=1 Tax=Nyctereutes procyonoides TaxID=34880 RepID=A0A811ZIM4_NYCPR|nr:unnamed protein product [Nyctereutes procyonoides]CAD7688324.1 unnamed protein product [Nyctereutes procyonoides]